MNIQAVLFDLDFTLAKPGPDLGPEGYERLGRRFGLELDPATYKEARAKAVEGLRKHPDFRHDEEIWVAFTERIIRGMGGDSDRAAEFAVEMTRAWEHAHNFDLYDDVPPVLDELRRRGLKLGIVSNTGRDVHEFLAHHKLEVDAALSSRVHGKVKPHPTIFQAVLDSLGVPADQRGDGRRFAGGRPRGRAGAGDAGFPRRPGGRLPGCARPPARPLRASCGAGDQQRSESGHVLSTRTPGARERPWGHESRIRTEAALFSYRSSRISASGLARLTSTYSPAGTRVRSRF